MVIIYQLLIKKSFPKSSVNSSFMKEKPPVNSNVTANNKIHN